MPESSSTPQPVRYRKRFVVLIIVLAFLGFAAYRGLHSIRWGIGEALQHHMEICCKGYSVPVSAINPLLSGFQAAVENVKQGRIGIRQAFSLMDAFEEGPLFLALLQEGFLGAYNSEIAEFGQECNISNPHQQVRNAFFILANGKDHKKSSKMILGYLIEPREFCGESSMGLPQVDNVKGLNLSLNKAQANEILQEMASLKGTPASCAGTLDPTQEWNLIMQKLQSETLHQ